VSATGAQLPVTLHGDAQPATLPAPPPSTFPSPVWAVNHRPARRGEEKGEGKMGVTPSPGERSPSKHGPGPLCAQAAPEAAAVFGRSAHPPGILTACPAGRRRLCRGTGLAPPTSRQATKTTELSQLGSRRSIPPAPSRQPWLWVQFTGFYPLRTPPHIRLSRYIYRYRFTYASTYIYIHIFIL